VFFYWSSERVWEFIRDLLKEREYCPSLICWMDHENGVFRLVSGQKVAKLWGDKKGNKEMSYEKFSRAMRWVSHNQLIINLATHKEP